MEFGSPGCWTVQGSRGFRGEWSLQEEPREAHSGSILTRNLAAFCPGAENLSKVKFQRKRLWRKVKKVLRAPTFHAGVGQLLNLPSFMLSRWSVQIGKRKSLERREHEELKVVTKWIQTNAGKCF